MQKQGEILNNRHKSPDDDRKSKRCPWTEDNVRYLTHQNNTFNCCRFLKKKKWNLQLQKWQANTKWTLTNRQKLPDRQKIETLSTDRRYCALLNASKGHSYFRFFKKNKSNSYATAKMICKNQSKFLSLLSVFLKSRRKICSDSRQTIPLRNSGSSIRFKSIYILLN